MGKSTTDARGEIHRREAILASLAKAYREAAIALTYHNPWELLVAVILSAQCTDKRVNLVTPGLFTQFPSIKSFRDAPIERIENAIRSTGFFKMKARHIQESARTIIATFGGEVPRTMRDMLTLPGVARKTANVVLGNAYGVVEGIAVDTHMIRLSQRLRLVNLSAIGGKIKMFVNPYDLRPKTYDLANIDFIKDADPVKIEKELMSWIPKNKWMRVTYQLIDHGRGVCKALRPVCSECPLFALCPVSR